MDYTYSDMRKIEVNLPRGFFRRLFRMRPITASFWVRNATTFNVDGELPGFDFKGASIDIIGDVKLGTKEVDSGFFAMSPQLESGVRSSEYINTEA